MRSIYEKLETLQGSQTLFDTFIRYISSVKCQFSERNIKKESEGT